MATSATQQPSDSIEVSAPLFAAGFLIAWSVNLPLAGGISTASITVLATAPLWVATLGRFRWATGLLILVGIALVNGVLLAAARSVTLPFSANVGLAQAMHIVGGLGGIGVILWTRKYLSLPRIAVIVGSTMLISGITEIGTSTNPWKYQLSVPIAVVALGLLDRARVPINVAALLALSLLGIANDYRSMAGVCLLTAGLLLLQSRQVGDEITWGRRATWIALGVASLAALYFLGTALLVEGSLGEEVQRRSLEQIDRGGSLIAGGRPEWSGTVELAQSHPLGFGLGAIPTYADVWTARAGLVRVGVSTDNGYVDHYMFGGQFKLHSVTADLWAQCGLFGLALGVALIAAMSTSLIDRIGTGTAHPVLVFLAVFGLWNMAFAPIYSALPLVGLAVGLLLRPMEAPERGITTYRRRRQLDKNPQ